MSDTRKDALECNILKEVRNQLINLGRWTKSNLLAGDIEGETNRYDYNTQDWSWQAWEDAEFSLDSNDRVMQFGKIMVEDPATPEAALASLRLGEADDEDETETVRKLKPIHLEVCTVGAIYLAAGMNGVEYGQQKELVQVMVATGRAIKNHMRSSRHELEHLSSEALNMTLPYTLAGMVEAENVIISFNDGEDTTSGDIEAVLVLADIELACIRGEAPVLA